MAESTAALIVSLAGGYSHVVAPATTDAKNVMPRVAALLDVMVISDISGVVDADTFERPIYAGNAIQTVKSHDATKVITVRTSTFDAAGDGGSAAVETVGAAGDPGLAEWVEDKVAASDRPMSDAPEPDLLGRGPLFVNDRMVDLLTDQIDMVVEVVGTRDEIDAGLGRMIYGPLEEPAAREMLGPVVYERAARKLCGVLDVLAVA